MRACGSCSQCCRLLEIPELSKPAGTWCTHCSPGHGCKIHPERPQVCRDYACEWLAKRTPYDWFPARAKIIADYVTVAGERTPYLRFTVDPAYPQRWREPRRLRFIKRQAQRGLATKQWHTVVSVAGQWTLILPDKEVPHQKGTLVKIGGTFQFKPLDAPASP